MPPKVKFTRDEIIAAALELVREKGIDSITARALGEKLGISSRPIFTAFQNMEEVQQEIINASRTVYNEYIKKGLNQTLAFKGVGMQYIQFAIEEPSLFRILFMKEQSSIQNINHVLLVIDENYRQILSSIEENYGINEMEAKKLYQHLWVYTHGIATLCVTKMCLFSEEEIDNMITEIFIGQLKEIKEGRKDD